MEIWRSFPEAVAGLAGRRTALTIGTFDGVHRGHRRVIDELCREARKQDLLSIALTFAGHPAAVVGTDPPPLLTTLEERLALLARSGLESALVIPFDDD
ncbi:MAG: adenylyltransferase/cytidyltransferase family protein, partial [Bacteroidota bacterium]